MEDTMSSSSPVAQGPLQELQIYRLLQLVHKADEEAIGMMMRLGVENLINLTEPKEGMGALHLAVSLSSIELVSFLLSLGAQPDIQDKRGRTPVMLAAQQGNNTLVDLLIQNKADLLVKDNEGKGVLFYCTYPTKAHFCCLQAALNFQADPNNVSVEGTHVFQQTCEKTQDYPSMCFVMLDSGADPDASNQKTGVTALMEAARAGSVELVRAILHRGGSPNTRDEKLLSAVHYAAMGGFLDVVQVLSAFAADFGTVSLDEYTPLHYAAAAGNANCCMFLAQRGCNPKLKNNEGLLPRNIAKNSGQKAAAKALRKAEKQHGKGKKPTNAGLMSDPWALILHDWSNEHEMELRQSFEGGSDRVSAEMFISVLEDHKAPVEIEQLQIVVRVHEKDRVGSVNINDFFSGVKYIKKPFRLASFLPKRKKPKKGKKGKKKKGKCPFPICMLPQDRMDRRAGGGPPYIMIEKYCYCLDPDNCDSDQRPEHYLIDDIKKPNNAYININHCVRKEDLDSVDLAFRHGVPVDVQDEFYKTPLMLACASGNYKLVKYLLSKGASVNIHDQFFWTPLHHAASSGNVETVELLVAAGATIDERSLSRVTPLMRAIESSQPACVDFLINAGADVTAENKKGLNCLNIANTFQDTTVIDLVKTKMDSLPKAAEGKGGKGQKSK